MNLEKRLVNKKLKTCIKKVNKQNKLKPKNNKNWVKKKWKKYYKRCNNKDKLINNYLKS